MDPIEAAEQNYLAAWRFLAGTAEGGIVDESDDVLFTSIPVPVPYFNSAFVKPHADPAACIETIKAFFGARNTPFTLRFRDDGSARAADACAAASLDPVEGTSPLMVAAVDDIAPPADVEIRRVDAATWGDHQATVASGFGMPLELVKKIFRPALVEGDQYAGFNAYVDGQAASTAALIMSGDVAGVYNVATPESFRRRGLGEATTRAVVAEGARRGCVLTTLQASVMGYPIYERMGFRTVARWRGFTG